MRLGVCFCEEAMFKVGVLQVEGKRKDKLVFIFLFQGNVTRDQLLSSRLHARRNSDMIQAVMVREMAELIVEKQ